MPQNMPNVSIIHRKYINVCNSKYAFITLLTIMTYTQVWRKLQLSNCEMSAVTTVQDFRVNAVRSTNLYTYVWTTIQV